LLFDFTPYLMATDRPWPTMKEQSQHRDDPRSVGLRSHGPVALASRQGRDRVAGWGIRIAKPRFLVYQLL